MKIQEQYASDKPVLKEKDDKFQRYGFSKRIAETIVNRKSKESIVFGVFGAWGEGKTSVVNFIKQEISTQDDNFIQVSFNPWRFMDEVTLLTSFFNLLAFELSNAIPESVEGSKGSKKSSLKTTSEGIGDMLREYGGIASVFGAGDAIKTIGTALSNVPIETLKERIEDLLLQNKKRIVVYLDDIDRLDQNEIHSIFRLVKLTGDFNYTTFVLSFDEEMVSASIGQRFGSGEKKSGENYLEKIIQIPLNIPKAQPEALKSFCLNLVDNAFETNSVPLKEEEAERFVYQFTTNLLSRLSTPRLAVRYGNAISFSLPLLYGEVNIPDLMLIEALKVFYPNHYNFIKGNPDFFCGSYISTFENKRDSIKIERLKEQIERLGNSLKPEERTQVLALVINLFPRLDTVFKNYQFTSSTKIEWYSDKRIVSPKYFDRYFSYVVVDGDISDVEFEKFLKDVSSDKPIREGVKKFNEILKSTTQDNLVYKLRSRELKYDWVTAKNLVLIICDFSGSLQRSDGFRGFDFDTPYGQANTFIFQVCKSHMKNPELFDFAKELMTYPEDFNFAYEINNWFRSGKEPEARLFNENQYQELAKALTDRAVKESGKETIFKKYTKYVGYLTHSWAERDKTTFDDYVLNFLNSNVLNISLLITSYVPVGWSSLRPESYLSDLTQEYYDFIVGIIDGDVLTKYIFAFLEVDKSNYNQAFWIRNSEKVNTNENVLNQFLHWHYFFVK